MDEARPRVKVEIEPPDTLLGLYEGTPLTERFHDWSDLSSKSMDEAHPKDRLLTNIMLYWVTGAINSSFWPYFARRHSPRKAPYDLRSLAVQTSTFLAPLAVLMRMGKKANRKTTATLTLKPIPSHIINSGVSATCGVA